MKILLLLLALLVPALLVGFLTQGKPKGRACPTGCKGCGRCFKKNRN